MVGKVLANTSRVLAYVKDEIVSCRKKGMTIFLSSHILADMDEICDRVAVLNNGKIEFHIEKIYKS